MSETPPNRVRLIPLIGEKGIPSLAGIVQAGLTLPQKKLSCFFFYDAVGSQLFEEICNLPEYYLTREEQQLLSRYCDEMTAGLVSNAELVELGSGSSTKTRLLLDSLNRTATRLTYIPIDISEHALTEAMHQLSDDYPSLEIIALLADYRLALAHLSQHLKGTRLFAFLGSSLGNYSEADAIVLLRQIRDAMGPEDRLLLGTDMVKPRRFLEAAYDDSQGITARFNLNLLARINRELGADFHLDWFRHQARYDAEAQRVEMHLISTRPQVVRIESLDLTIRFDEGEMIHTEDSHKYTPERLSRLAQSSGMLEEAVWSDERDWFRLQRWKPCF